MRARDITPPGFVEADGKLHRFPTNGKARDDSGWYVMHEDGIPAGAFGDWRTDVSETWRANIGRRLSPQEDTAHRARMDAMHLEREAENAKRKTESREKAATIWDAAWQAPSDHSYLTRKGVKAHELRVHEGALVIPMRDGSELHSLQFIDAEGDKRFLTGGRVSGCYYPIGVPSTKPDGVLCICEGYATGASIHEATGYAVAVAFNTGNMGPVAKALRGKYPDVKLILCADDDYLTDGNPGLTKAREAASAVGGLLAVPAFGEDRPEGATDFNDLHRHVGPEAVRSSIERSMADVPKGALPDDDKADPDLQDAEFRGERAEPQHPVLNDAAFHGVAGKVVSAFDPHTESDRAAILFQLLAYFGNAVGRQPYFLVEGTSHHVNLFAVLVGATSRGRKGTAGDRVASLFRDLQGPKVAEQVTRGAWGADNIATGLSSGEGLIFAVRDPVHRKEKTGKGKAAVYEDVCIDEGVPDKRLLVIEPEFASVLQVMQREKNTLSALVRKAWDGNRTLRTMTRNSPLKATDGHISLIGHTTRDDLARNLDRCDVANGFANRFLFVCVKRSKLLPHGGALPDSALESLKQEITSALSFARFQDRVVRDSETNGLWESVYPALTADGHGMAGALLARAEAQCSGYP